MQPGIEKNVIQTLTVTQRTLMISSMSLSEKADSDASLVSLSTINTADSSIKSFSGASAHLTNAVPARIAFVDTGIADIETLIAGLEDTQIVLIDHSKDGLAQMSAALTGLSDIEAIEIFSHGADGLLQLGSTLLDQQNVGAYSSQIQQWSRALTAQADVMIYSCNLAAGKSGRSLLNQISQLTGADVAASNDLTGTGGDWDLEVATGQIDVESALSTSAQATFDGTLQLLGNGDFENGLTDWQFFRAPGTLTTDAVSGTQAIEIAADSRGLKQTVVATAGETYRLTGSAKMQPAGRATLGMTFYDADRNSLGGGNQKITQTSWNTFEVEKVAPAGTASVRVWAYKDAPDSLFLDNLELSTDSADPNPGGNDGELLRNPGFESGLNRWQRFTGSENTSTSDALEGNRSLRLSAARSGVRQIINVTPGEMYTVKGAGKSSSSGYAGFGLAFYDADNNEVTGSGISQSVRNADWQQYEKTTVAPNMATTARLWIYKADATGETLIDQLSLTAANGSSSGDTIPPAASLSASDINVTDSEAFFAVNYSDVSRIDVSTIDSSDLEVSGPGGFSQIATLVSVDNGTNGSPRTALYRIDAPGGSWDSSENGTYSVSLRASQVSDTAGNSAPSGLLGSFEVAVGAPAEPGVIGLDNSQLSVNEADGSVTVTVNRTEGTDGRVTVDYRTVNGSASANSDYTPMTGTLVFESGESQQSVSVPILDDNAPEGQETFGFAIDNVTGGATLLAPRTAQISISDNDGFTYEGNQYVLTTGEKTWLEAQAEAESLGGNLVSINSAAEETWLKQTFSQTEGFWIGINDIDTEGRFEWASGDPVTYTNWAPGEPNDGLFRQDFGWMNYTITRQWDDDSPDVVRRGIIEIGDFNGPAGGQGNGLKGEYYNNIDFTDLQFTRTDTTVDFNWGEGAPVGGINADTFSVRWTGRVEPLYSETYTFQTRSDDGVRLWVNNQLIIDRFVDQPPTVATGTIALEAGEQYDIRLEYYENEGGAVSQLSWQSASQSLEIIPRSQLYSAPVDERALTRETVLSNLIEPTAIDWLTDGSDRMFVAEKRGVVKVVENGQVRTTPFVDISDQVNGVRDRGLLDIAIHPDFTSNPYVYLLFTYDPPEVFNNSGNAGPDGENNRAGRLIRVTADATNNYRTAVPGSEVVLLGKNSTWDNFNGFVNSTNNLSEPPAGILPDGSNLQDFLAADSESHTVGAVEFGPDGALYVTNGDGTSYNQVDRRSDRVQDIDNLSGKVLRIDPITGQGLSDNPFYNGDADANRSKVYQLGLRNPFRMTIDPDSGQVYIGDVGWTRWEEINAAGPGANFGWPYYEGGNGQSQRTGGYRDLPEAQAFYNSGQVVTPSLLGLNHATDGINAIVLGDVYKGDAFPDRYQGDLFFGDLGRGIIRNASFDGDGNVSSVETFDNVDPYVVQMVEGPDGQLYYVNLVNGTVSRWRFV